MMLGIILKLYALRRKIKLLFYKVLFHQKLYANKIYFRNNFYLRVLGDAKLIIGNNTFFNNQCSVVALHKITIGENCLFGENVKIYDHNHRFNQANTLISKQGFYFKDVVIGNNVWCGSNVTILAGARIGDNSVIGAGCVIKSEIPCNSLVIRNDDLEIQKIVYK